MQYLPSSTPARGTFGFKLGRRNRRSQRYVSRIKRQCRTHTIGDVGICDPCLRIGETEGTARSGMPKRARMTEGRSRTGLAETKRGLDFAFHALIIEAALGWDRRSHQQPQRLGAQPQFLPSSRKFAVGTCNRSRRADASARCHFKIARINALRIIAYCSARVCYERAVDI